MFFRILTDAFGMTKLHKDIAMKLMECVQDEEYTDQATIKVGATYLHAKCVQW